MCRRVTCPQCGKPTFAGCGAHVEQVLGDVPKPQRCQGHQAEKPSEATNPAPASWFGRMLGRK